MKIWRVSEDRAEKFLSRLLTRQRDVTLAGPDEKARGIVAEVARRGDRALASLVRRHDLKGLAAAQFRLEPGGEQVSEDFVAAVEVAVAKATAFHEPQAQHGYTLDHAGGELGVRVRPLDSVGVVVPAGPAGCVSSLLAAAVPARLAGVVRIAVAVHPASYLSSPHLRYVLERLDLNEVYLMGGAHAVAALALGTESVVAVDKVVGSGDRLVAAAKRVVRGIVDVDLAGGPAEAVLLADEHAEADLVAAEMLAQAEIDPEAAVVLLTPSRPLAEDVERAVAARLRSLPRGAAARVALKDWGAILLAADLDEAVAIVNRIAPGCVTVLVEEPRRLVDGIENAGTIYLGPWSSAALGDCVLGCSRMLPTAGAARFSSPLGVWDFVHRTAVVRVPAHGFAALAKAARAVALHERLPLHAEALRSGRRGRP